MASFVPPQKYRESIMKHSYFFDEDQLEKWVSAAENLRQVVQSSCKKMHF
ncbi:MAG: hypothetical protein ACYDIA_16730 [Candidatus Humimicrobiaceae bacterium]